LQSFVIELLLLENGEIDYKLPIKIIIIEFIPGQNITAKSSALKQKIKLTNRASRLHFRIFK